MIFRLYAIPLSLYACSLGVLFILGIFIPRLFARMPILDSLATLSAACADPAFLILLSAGLLTSVFQTYRLYRWNQGEEACCKHCGGLLSGVRSGRYGLYCKCLACGKGQQI